MHDTDRTLAEAAGSVFEPESYDFGELEADGSSEFEYDGQGEFGTDGQEFEGDDAEFEVDMQGEVETDGRGEFEADYPGEFEVDMAGAAAASGGPLGEVDEMELAAELLAVSDEAELDQFLGRFIRRASRGVRTLARSPLGNQLGGLLKNAARKLVPAAATALGGLVGGPAGMALGEQLAAAAAKNFGFELEALSQEDQEFELARGYVRFANEAVRQAARMPARVPAPVAARASLARAARRHAPGLLRRRGGTRSGIVQIIQAGSPQGRRTGRWVRVAPGVISCMGSESSMIASENGASGAGGRGLAAGPLVDGARALLADDARALLTRLDRVRPFALHETMVPAASVSVVAQRAIEGYLMRGRRELRQRVRGYLAWLGGPAGLRATPAEAHARFALLRLRFNVVLANFDLFATVMTQRSEHETGVWLAGLDIVASDALAVPGVALDAPPVVCYLDRGMGAAIRRAKTRLPGGGENPVAVVRLPRERMVGSGVASSLVHEVGHQGAVLLDLLAPLRDGLRAAERAAPPAERRAWRAWERWISEIVPDLWSVARVGVAATLGLMGVVSLPRAFVIRGSATDPHPTPWIRVRLSCALGDALYPDPQWRRLSALWASFYPPRDMPPAARAALAELDATIPAFVAHLLGTAPRGSATARSARRSPRRTATPPGCARCSPLGARRSYGCAPRRPRSPSPSSAKRAPTARCRPPKRGSCSPGSLRTGRCVAPSTRRSPARRVPMHGRAPAPLPPRARDRRSWAPPEDNSSWPGTIPRPRIRPNRLAPRRPRPPAPRRHHRGDLPRTNGARLPPR
jgi:hypothetical protein